MKIYTDIMVSFTESRETFRNAYRTPEQFGSSSSDEEEDDGTFYDAEGKLFTF